MTVLVVLSSPNTDEAPDSVPRRIMAELPALQVEVVHIDRDGATAKPYFWIRGASTDDFEAVLAADPNISIDERIERTADGVFYKAAWDVDSPIIHCVSAANGIVLEAAGDVDEWRLKIWFEDRSATSSFQECCTNLDIPLTIHRLASVTDYFSNDGVNLSPRQREALVLAYGKGYFEEPRETSQAQLAEELGISSSAFGRRLRRGLDTLIGETIVD